jgi:LmbE family N-acetylglucosaminyl deacetylase
MITTEDLRSIYSYADKENYNRQKLNALLGRDAYPLIDPEQIIAEREQELRRSAAEAGAREYAIKQLDVEGATRPAVATALGAATVGAQRALADAIESVASRPKYEGSPVLTEIARAI